MALASRLLSSASRCSSRRRPSPRGPPGSRRARAPMVPRFDRDCTKRSHREGRALVVLAGLEPRRPRRGFAARLSIFDPPAEITGTETPRSPLRSPVASGRSGRQLSCRSRRRRVPRIPASAARLRKTSARREEVADTIRLSRARSHAGSSRASSLPTRLRGSPIVFKGSEQWIVVEVRFRLAAARITIHPVSRSFPPLGVAGAMVPAAEYAHP